jgi:hypothetical protein
MSDAVVELLERLDAGMKMLSKTVVGIPDRAASAAGQQVRKDLAPLQGAAEASRTATEALMAAARAHRRLKVVSAILGALVAFCGGVSVGHWLIPPGIWHLSLTQPGSCARAGGLWQVVEGRGVCSFWVKK